MIGFFCRFFYSLFKGLLIDRCTFLDGILSDNKFHPEHPAWFAKPESGRVNRPQDTTYLSNVADCIDETLEGLRNNLCSESAIDRAFAYQAIGNYHGFENLDTDPLIFHDRRKLEKRYENILTELKSVKL